MVQKKNTDVMRVRYLSCTKGADVCGVRVGWYLVCCENFGVWYFHLFFLFSCTNHDVCFQSLLVFLVCDYIICRVYIIWQKKKYMEHINTYLHIWLQLLSHLSRK
ncbi:hypothetical protein DFH27DRAFT_303170 [Peziza echinospora]|nr:hypothetical protein DFH27DRAFT_303170 [Peziza echinospora]